MNTRIGRKLLLAILICIVLTISAESTIIIFRATSYINSLMVTHAETGMKSLISGMETQQDRLSDIIDVLTITLSQNETADLNSIWEGRKETDSDFAALMDGEGNVFWKSDNYDLADFSTASVGNGFEGIVVDSKAGLTVQAAGVFIRDGKFNGAVVVGMYLSENSWLDKLKEDTESELTIFSGSTRYATTITDNGKRAVGTSMAETVTDTVIGKGEPYEGTAMILGQNHFVSYHPMQDINGKVVGAYFSGLSSSEADSLKSSLIIMSVIVSVVIAAASLVIIGYVVIKTIVKPIKQAETISNEMSQGLLSRNEVNIKLGNDELGDFVRKLQSTEKSLSSYISDIKDVLSQMATGDFTAEPHVTYIGDFTEIKTSFDQISEALREIIGEISETSRDVMNGSMQISEGSQTLAEGTTRQAASVEELSATINEITEKVEQNAQNAAEAGRISSESADKIEFQNGEVQNMLSAMDEIKEKSEHHQGDRRYCVPDEYPFPQRGYRSGPRGRSGQRLRGRCGRGPHACSKERGIRKADRRPYQRDYRSGQQGNAYCTEHCRHHERGYRAFQPHQRIYRRYFHRVRASGRVNKAGKDGHRANLHSGSAELRNCRAVGGFLRQSE